MTQANQILQMLKQGKRVTPFSALAICGSLACHSRISELRDRGHRIECRIVTRNGRRFGEYRLMRKVAA